MKYTVFVFSFAAVAELRFNSYALAEEAFNLACRDPKAEVVVFVGDGLINNFRRP
jgi:hypothetical protein